MKSKIFLLFILCTTIIFANESKLGDTISQFSANDENGNLWKLQDNLNQKYLVVYFYPIALTGG
jgi:thioredoxin-dependent peroxiredoxin